MLRAPKPFTHLARTRTRCYSSQTNPFSKATFLASAATPTSIPELNGLPEVIVTGRANSGKSTLLNTLMGRNDIFHTSSKAGRTKTLNFVQVGPGPGNLVLVDAPGYGARGRPEWGEVFDYYLRNRAQLRRVYILFNAKHPLNQFDHQMLAHLSSLLVQDGVQRWTLQAVITKADSIVSAKGKAKRKGEEEGVIGGMMKEIWEHAPLCLAPVVTSAVMVPPFGVDSLKKGVLDACGIVGGGE